MKCRHKHDYKEDVLYQLYIKYTNLGGYDGTKHFLDISLDGSFENGSLCYEDWCAVWTVRLHAVAKTNDWQGRWSQLDVPIVTSSRCLECAFEQAMMKLKTEEDKRNTHDEPSG